MLRYLVNECFGKEEEERKGKEKMCDSSTLTVATYATTQINPKRNRENYNEFF